MKKVRVLSDEFLTADKIIFMINSIGEHSLLILFWKSLALYEIGIQIFMNKTEFLLQD